MAAELRLGVSFDLVYFRQQLQKLSQIAASEFTGVVKLGIDKRHFQRQFNALTRELRLNVNDSQVSAAISRVETLASRLDALKTRKVKLSVEAAITRQDVANFRNAVKDKLSGIKVQVGVEPTGATGASAGAPRATATRRPSFLESPAYQKELASIARANAKQLASAAKNLPEGRNRKEVERLLDELAKQNPQGAQRTGALQAIRELIARGRYQQGLGIEARMGGLDPSRRGPFPYVAKTGPINESSLFQESQRVAAQIDQQNTAIARQAAEQARAIASQMEALRASSSRLLPPGAARQGTSAQEAAVSGFYRRMRDAEQMFARNFSANSYLPKASRGLASAMEQASAGIKALPAGRGAAGALPSTEMLAQRQFRSAIEAAIRADMQNALRQQMQGRMLPAAGQTGFVAGARQQLAGQRFAAPRLGGAGDAISQVMAQSGPVADRLRSAAVEFSKNAPAVIKYLNLFSTAGGINISDLPAAGETPGQYIRRIQQSLQASLKQGGFGPATPANRQFFQYGGGPQTPGYPVQLALPPSRTGGGDRVTGGEAPGALAFPGGAMGPTSQIPSPGVAKFAAQIRGVEGSLNQARLPLAGAVAELGDEFATAAKQVLLYGTAYKALAFFTNLPAQAFDAAKALQTFENQLQAVTGSAASADRSFAFIDDLANRFNVPLQSARDGFVKLYASMAPAGFSASEIEGLFEGISKATATFGLSADKVDRVNYAFAQMASKGQIMSEELKGQLGDVLPGSLALFARAAQMSIPEFSKAMEDGAFKGAAMAQVLRNVARIMNADFAGAAANSALTLQGALNGMQNSVQRLYEAFEPLVAAIGVQVFPILSEVIGQATQAVTAFSAAVQGNQGPASMLDGNARAIYDAFVAVREIITAVGGVIQGIAPSFIAFGRAALFVAESIAKFVNTPAGGFLADLAVKAGIALLALQTLARLGIGTLISSLLLAARNATTFTAAIRGMVIALRTSEVAAKAFRTAMLGLVGAGVMFAIEALIQQIGRLANRLSDARKRAVEARDAIRSMSDTELVAERQKRQRNIFLLQKIQRAGGKITSRADAKALEEMGMSVAMQTTRQRGPSGIQYKVDPSLIESYIGREQGLLTEAQYTYKNRDFTPPSPELEKITPAPPKEKKERSRKLQDFTSDEVANLKTRLEYEKLAIENNIELSKRQKEVAIADLEYSYGLKIVDAQLKAATASVTKYKEGQRGAAIQEANIMANQEKLNLQRKFEQAVVGGIIDQSEAYADKLIELSVGTEDLSEAQKNEVFIKKQVQGLNAEQLKTIEPLLKRLRDQAKAVDEVTKAEERRLELKKQREEIDKSLTDLQSRIGVEGAGLRAGFIGKAGDAYEETLLKPGATTADALRAAELTQQLEQVTMVADMLKNSATGIGEAFAQSFSSVLTGAESAKAALGNFFSNIGKMFADMAAKMLAQWMVMKAVGLVASIFGGGASMGGGSYFDPKTGLGVAGPNFGLANGGVINGTFMPITPFATGGMVTGPTLGLVGEGRFNEAVVPLPDGKSIPVDLGGGTGNDISTNIVVNVNNGQAQSNVSGSGGNQLAKQLDAAVKEVILRETRPGGIIYSSR